MSSSRSTEWPCVRIVCVGDSLTGPAPGTDYLADYLKWTDLLQVGLDAVFGVGSVKVFNQGKAGETSSGLRASLDRHLEHSAAQFAVVWIGANNYADAASHEATSSVLAEDLHDILRRVAAAGVRPLVVQYPEPRAENMARVWTHVDAGNDTIAAVAAETSVPLADLRPGFRRAAELQSLANLVSPIDGVHLRPGGEVVVARALLSKLKELGWPASWPQPDSDSGRRSAPAFKPYHDSKS